MDRPHLSNVLAIDVQCRTNRLRIDSVVLTLDPSWFAYDSVDGTMISMVIWQNIRCQREFLPDIVTGKTDLAERDCNAEVRMTVSLALDARLYHDSPEDSQCSPFVLLPIAFIAVSKQASYTEFFPLDPQSSGFVNALEGHHPAICA